MGSERDIPGSGLGRCDLFTRPLVHPPACDLPACDLPGPTPSDPGFLISASPIPAPAFLINVLDETKNRWVSSDDLFDRRGMLSVRGLTVRR
jgi:hypothetical protein